VIVTLASGIGAPLLSLTTPDIDPVLLCPGRVIAIKMTNPRDVMNRLAVDAEIMYSSVFIVVG